MKHKMCTQTNRLARPTELPCSKFDPELFSHSAYLKFFVTFMPKVPYQTFCYKMRQFWFRKWIGREEIKRKWGNVESKSLSIPSFTLHFLSISSLSFHFLIFSPFPFHFLILSPFSHSPAARLPQVVQPWYESTVCNFFARDFSQV